MINLTILSSHPGLSLIIILIGFVVAIVSAQNDPYYTTTDLGSFNHNAATGNPLKGFLSSPDWNSVQQLNSFPTSLEFYYVGLNKVMTDYNTFDWDTYLEPRLNNSESRNRHVILRFILDYPTEPSYVPQFLIDDGLTFKNYSAYGGGQSPDYNNTNLRTALLQFIQAFGERYDGDTRIGFVQVGLLGFWGEWHTYTDGTTDDWIPGSLKNDVVSSFQTYFSTTPIQVRYPWPAAIDAGFGLHDDSFAYATLDGVYNGGINVAWFFWRLVQDNSYTNFWKTSVMGGEIYPDLQGIIFQDSYPTGTSYHQDFFACNNVTHSTYMLNYKAFEPGYSGNTLTRATLASQSLGYAFIVSQVQVAEGASQDKVAITITIKQMGVAPFYYPLDLTLSCSGMSTQTMSGVEQIVEEGSSNSFTFTNVPANSVCLNAVEIAFSSIHVYGNNPVKFSQGDDGTNVVVSLPLPGSTLAPTPTPTSSGTSNCNDSSLKFKIQLNGRTRTRSCTWVAKKKTIQRCAKDDVSTHCAETCGSCSTCQDSIIRFKLPWNGRVIARTCTWVAKKNSFKKCSVDGVSDTCRETCQQC